MIFESKRRKHITEEVNKVIDNALTRSFYEARDNDFDGRDIPIYLGVFKDKLICLNLKTAYTPELEPLIKIGDPKLFGTKREHATNIVSRLNFDQKTDLAQVCSAIKGCSIVDSAWRYIHNAYGHICEDYFENYLRFSICKFSKTAEYRKLSKHFTLALMSNTERCTDFQTSRLVAQLIQTLNYQTSFNNIDRLSDDLHLSNIFKQI